MEEHDKELTLEEKEAVYRRAVWRARARLGLYIHAGIFAGIMLLLAVINLLTSPGVLWVVWPLFGWGLGLLCHWFLTFKLVQMHETLTTAEIARELEHRKSRGGGV